MLRIFFYALIMWPTPLFAQDTPADSGKQKVANEAPDSEAKVSQKAPKAEKEQRDWHVRYGLMHRSFVGTLTTGKTYLLRPESLWVTSQSMTLGYSLSKNGSLSITAKHLKNEILLKSDLTIPGMPSEIRDETQGLADTEVGYNYSFIFGPKNQLIVSGLVSLPTGDYQQKTSSGKLVSYPGQLGSGTYDLVPRVVYMSRMGSFDLHTRVQGKIRTGRNDLDYRLGDEVMVMGSAGWWFSRYAALTASFYFRNWREVNGAENVTAFNQAVSAKARAGQGGRHGGPPRTQARPGEDIPHGSGNPHGRSPHGHGANPHANPHGPGGRPYGGPGTQGGPPPGVRTAAFSNITTTDPFAASGARSSVQLGVKTGFYFGPQFLGFLEAGVPVYSHEVGELEGLETQWFVMTSIMSSF